MRGRFHPNKIHADRENLIMWFLLIWLSDLGIGHTVTTVKISRSFLWYAMNELMHVMQLWFFGYINGHFSHLPRLNYECKIECLHLSPYGVHHHVHLLLHFLHVLGHEYCCTNIYSSIYKPIWYSSFNSRSNRSLLSIFYQFTSRIYIYIYIYVCMYVCMYVYVLLFKDLLLFGILIFWVQKCPYTPMIK